MVVPNRITILLIITQQYKIHLKTYMACKEINLKYKTSNKTYSHSIRVQPTGTISLKAKMVAKGSEMTQ